MTRWLPRALTLLAIFIAAPAVAETPPTRAQVEKALNDAKGSMGVDPQLTIRKAIAARQLAERMSGPERGTEIATALWLQGVASSFAEKPDDAGHLLASAMNIVQRVAKGSKLNADILLARGNWNADRANITDALRDYQAAHEVYGAIGDSAGQTKALTCIAGIYLDANDFKGAIKYLDQALAASGGEPRLLIPILSNRGDALRELKQYDEAEADFRKALDLARKLDSPGNEATILRNMARAELSANRLDAADRTIAEAFRLTAGNSGSDDNAQLWAVAAQAALQGGRLADARRMIERSLAGAGPAADTVDFWDARKTAYSIYKALGDKPNALIQLEARKLLDDQTTRIAASASAAVVSAQFDFANQELKIAKLRADEAKRRADTQFWVFVGSGIAAIVIFGMLGFGLITIRRSRDQVRAANVDLASTNVALGKALAAKTEFLATTSHEIRTPLNGILGMTQVMLADQRLDATMRDRIGVVHGAGVSMRALVDDILDVAKMETGNLTIEKAPVDLPAMLRDVSRMWEDQARAKGLVFELDTSGAPPRIESDPARLRQVAYNLLSNALKFTQQGSVHVSSGVVAGPDGEQVTIVIRDTGIGVPPEKLDLIFESFRQADAGTTRQFGGTGLGLAICRNIARALGGDVTVESEDGKGSTFTAAVPLVRLAEEAAVAAAADGGTLLIVDKNPISRAMLRTLFAPRVPALKVAGSIDEAVATIAAGGVDRVLTDEGTIAMNGDAEEGVRSLTGAPLSLLWTNPDDADRARLAAAGVDQLIAKPIAGTALVDAIVTGAMQLGVDSRAA